MLKNTKLLLALFALSLLTFDSLLPATAQNDLPLRVKQPEKVIFPAYVENEIIVKFKPGVAAGVINELNLRHGVTEKYESPYGKFKVLKIPKGKTVPEMVEIYTKNPNIEYAEPNSIARAFMTPTDPLYPYQWHFDNVTYGGIHMEAAWDISTGDPSVVVAVLDTGVAYEDYKGFEKAPDLATTAFVPGYDFINNDSHPNDDKGHGTHVTGTVAQSTNNSLGVAGIAFNTTIMPVKVLNKQGSGTAQSVADGVYFAANNGADIINLSLGWPVEDGVAYDPGATVRDAIAYAYNAGVTIVAASGNDNEPAVAYPAAYDDYVIAVGGTRYDEAIAYYSNTGSSLDLVAPGGDVTVDQNEDEYGDGVLQETLGKACDAPQYAFVYCFFQGTSMSSPHVSGVAALLLAQDSNRTPDDIRNILQSTAEDKGSSGWDQYYGYGIVDAYTALTFGTVVSITVTENSSFDYGILPLSPGSTTPTRKNTTELGKTPVIKNTGSATVDLSVKSSDAEGDAIPWALVAAGSIAADNYCHQYITDSGVNWTDFPTDNDYTEVIASGLGANDTAPLDLQILMPTHSSDPSQKSITVTIRATESGP